MSTQDNTTFRVLVFGDLMGSAGRRIFFDKIKGLIKEYSPDLVVLNGENAAGGFGITARMARSLFGVGVDVITSGNHIWDRKESLEALQDERVLRPANYPEGNPGKGFFVKEYPDGLKALVLNVQGRAFMPSIDCPFRVTERILQQHADAVIKIVDFHAEATAEKQAFAWYFDGKVSAVVGTHTHVQTCDERVLPGGTAYITDVGMIGAMDSVIGMKKEIAIERFLLGRAIRFELAEGRAVLCGVYIEIDRSSGRALSIKRINIQE